MHIPEEKRVNFKQILDSIENITLSDYTLDELFHTLQLYEEYLCEVNNLSESNKDIFLEAIRYEEMIGTQLFESKCDFHLTSAALSLEYKKDSITYLVENVTEHGIIRIPNLKKAHKIILEGTTIEKDDDDFRNKQVVVGYYDPNKKQNVIQYVPPKSEDIDVFMDKIIEFINLKIDNNTFHAMLLKPMVVHALIAILQPFSDGNTRLSRLVQCVDTWHSTNIIYNVNFDLPALYLSDIYLQYYGQYRELIQNLSLSPDQENWDRWIRFNLFRIQDKLMRMATFLEENFSITRDIRMTFEL